MELLLYSGGLRNSADEGSLLRNPRPYAAKMCEERAFARARAAASAGAPDSVCTTARGAPGTAVAQPKKVLKEAASGTPSRAHVPSIYARREPFHVCAARSQSNEEEGRGEEEEAESCALPALRTWDEGGATLDTVSKRGTLKAPCTPPKQAQQDMCFISSDSTDCREPVEDVPARPSVGSLLRGIDRNNDAMHGLIDEGTKERTGDEHDEKENIHAAPSWFCNIRTPSTLIVSPVYREISVPAPHIMEQANNLQHGFQTDPPGQSKCNELSMSRSAWIAR
jgi:hypothetical protein